MTRTIIITLLSAIFTIGAIFGISYIVVPAACYAQWNDTFPVRWSFLTDCMIKVDGVWIPARNYRAL